MKGLFGCDGGSKHERCVDSAFLVLRIVGAIVFILHGYGKLFTDAPGIPGFTGLLTSLGVPAPGFFAWVVALIEFLGGIALLVGLWMPVASILLAIVMVFAFFLVKKGFPAGDVDFALFGMMVALAMSGGGKICRIGGKGKMMMSEKKMMHEKKGSM